MTAIPRRTPCPRLLTPAEVARTFGVHPRTVSRWARTGRLPYVTTPGGRMRFHATAVDIAMTIYAASA